MKTKNLRTLNKFLAKIIFILVFIIFLYVSKFLQFPISIAAKETTEIHISSSGTDSGDGSDKNPYATLGKAIEVAEDNTIIYLDTDIFMGVDNKITKNITIKSNGDALHTLKREQNAEGYCLLIQEGGTLTLENIIIDGDAQTNSWFPVIGVENSTLNIENNAIVQNNNSHGKGAISLINSTFNMKDGEIKNSVSSMNGGAVYANNSKINISGNASIKNNKVTAESAKWPLNNEEKNGAHGGAFYIEGKSILNIADNTEISDNTAVLYGGGIFSWDSTIIMNGGKISNNHALKGAGIYCEGGSNFNFSNGEISQNQAKANSTLPDYNENIGGKGGGIMAVGSNISMSNSANILNNEAETEGGGINLNQSTFNMNGGKIDQNIASINGGGLILDNQSSATISSGYITNNVCDLTKFRFDYMDDSDVVLGTMETLGTGSEFAGGGIYLHFGCSLNITNVIISDNTNDQTVGIEAYPDKTAIGYSGNAIAMCPTADVRIYKNNGGAIYNNGDNNSFDIVAIPNSYITDYNFNHHIDEKTTTKFNNTNYALGGGFYGLTDFSGAPVSEENYNVESRLALKSHLSEESIEKANEEATVFITGNKSKGIFGAGGIACNGLLTIGTNDYLTGILKVSKQVVNDNTDKAFTFTVTLNNTNIEGTYGDMLFEKGIATFTLKNGENKVASNLPANIGYKVTETNNEGYTVTSTGDTGEILQEGITEVNFVNTKIINKVNDDTTADSKQLPQTGEITIWINAVLIILLFSLTYSFIKWKKYQHIEK